MSFREHHLTCVWTYVVPIEHAAMSVITKRVAPSESTRVSLLSLRRTDCARQISNSQSYTNRCRHFHGLQPNGRGAPLVCRTAAPTWAEPNALRLPEPSQRDADLIPSTSSSITLGSDGPWIRPTIKDTGTLRPAAEWYPQWMQYRRREDNYVFWQDKLMRCSLDIPCE